MCSHDRFTIANAARQRRFDRMQKLRSKKSMHSIGSSILGVRRGCEFFGSLRVMLCNFLLVLLCFCID